MKLFIAFFLSLVSLASAAWSSASCGKTQYSNDTLDQASDAACSYIKTNSTIGTTNKFPQEYKNQEKFKLQGLSGPFFEFPVLPTGQIYSGGSPGPDRVIVTSNCTQAGVLTHQDANGNSFHECTLKSSTVSAVSFNSWFALTVCFAATGFALAS